MSLKPGIVLAGYFSMNSGKDPDAHTSACSLYQQTDSPKITVTANTGLFGTAGNSQK
jgi:hypothetical protein